jgi:hypothetical protein
MAREESDREDLLREATALVRRIEFRVSHEAEPIVFGFRRDGAASVFLGADPVYQFNAVGELRRAYVGGKLFKADRGALAELTRVRTVAETQLVRRDLAAEETEKFLTAMTARLGPLCKALGGRVEVIGQVPPDGDLLSAVREELVRLLAAPRIASSPRAGL